MPKINKSPSHVAIFLPILPHHGNSLKTRLTLVIKPPNHSHPKSERNIFPWLQQKLFSVQRSTISAPKPTL
ncbi:hypothetical protein [Rubritalea tangerina]|uniref:hypothetical protein n=1 Tax=Rubritalea tangerina TaxID=430798 RepID=UPI0036224552